MTPNLKVIVIVFFIISPKVDFGKGVFMSVNIITKENFNEDVKNNEKTVLIDFYADWCGPCRMLSPFVEEIADEYPEIFVGKINVDNEPELASAFDVSSIPMLVVVKNGKIVSQSVGFRSKEQILSMLEAE